VHAVNAILPNLPAAGFELAATCARAISSAPRRSGGASEPRQAFDDVERMLEESELDAVVVVVPPEQFAGVISACIRRGVPGLQARRPAADDAAEAHAPLRPGRGVRRRS